MRIDTKSSRYQEESDLAEFDRHEVRKARVLLRRLRFLETQVKERGGLSADDSSGGAGYAEFEMEALEWALGPEGLSFITITEESK